MDRPIFEFFKSCAVDNIANVLFSAYGVGVYVVLHISVCIQNNLYNAVFIRPFDEVFT